LGEGAIERAAAMAAGAEADELLRIVGIGLAVVVRFDEAIDVDQDIGGRGLARQGMGGHKILSRAGGSSLSGRQIFYTMRRARFLAGCDRRARSFDLDRIEPGILNVDLKTGLAFDRGPKNLFDCI